MSRSLQSRLVGLRNLALQLCEPSRSPRISCPHRLTPLESALTQLFILKNFKFPGINTYKICMVALFSQAANPTHHTVAAKPASRQFRSSTSFASLTSELISPFSPRCSP
jgi:hypothetical protein